MAACSEAEASPEKGRVDSSAEADTELEALVTHSLPLWGLPAHNPRCLEALLAAELCDISYGRRICSYSANPFASGTEALPLVRRFVDSPVQRRESKSCESEPLTYSISSLGGENAIDSLCADWELNDSLSPSQRADAVGICALVRDRLHLVSLFELFADDANFKSYSAQVSGHLPSLISKWYLSKQRANALTQLAAHRIATRKHAIALLKETLSTLALKMEISTIGRLDDSRLTDATADDFGDERKEASDAHCKVRYFFSKKGASLFGSSVDACVVAEIVFLQCAQLPNKCLPEVMKEPLVSELLAYAKGVYNAHCAAIEGRPVLGAQTAVRHSATGKQAAVGSAPRNAWFFESWFAAAQSLRRGQQLADATEDTKRSILFVVGSAAALALYIKYLQPVAARKS